MHKAIAMLFLVVCIFAVSAFSQGDSEFSRPTLRGLKGVGVFVKDIERDAEKVGITTDRIQTDVELRNRGRDFFSKGCRSGDSRASLRSRSSIGIGAEDIDHQPVGFEKRIGSLQSVTGSL